MKTHHLLISIVGFLAVSCSSLGPLRATRGERIQIQDGIEARRLRLANGLRIVVIEDDSSPTFAYQTWFDVGSRDEEPGRTGLAHLFEHMMFKGTTNVPDGEFDKRLESAGAEGENAYTTQDHTTYVQELPKERLELIVSLEADRMRNLIVNDSSFSTEREVVQNERRFRNENSADGTLFQEIYGLAFQKHSYRWPVIGFEQDLASMSAADARAFYERHYSPDRAVIVVSGDVDADRVFELVTRYYGSYQAQTQARLQPVAEPEQTSARRKTLRLDLQVEKLMMGYPMPSMGTDEMPALDILQIILSGGRSSRLQKALVEPGIASAVYAYGASSKDPGLFLFGVTAQRGQRANTAERIILREIERIAREGVPDRELERAKNLVAFEYFSGMETNGEKARAAGHYESQMGGIEKWPDYYRKLQAVTALQVQQATARHFSESKRNVLVALKKTQAESKTKTAE